MFYACLLAAFAAVSATDIPGLTPSQVAIFKAESSTSYSTSYTYETTKITIVKHATQAALNQATGGALSSPRIVVKDAAKKGLVCLPRDKINRKSDEVIAVGQGKNTVAAVGGVASTSSSAASAGGAVSSSSAAASGSSATSSSAAGAGAGVEQYVPPCRPKYECTPTHLCDDDGFIITDGAGFLDVRTLTQGQRPSGKCRDDEVCCTLRDEDGDSGAITWVPEECGVRSPVELGHIDQRILGRHPEDQTEPGEFPWVVALLKRDKGGLLYVCAGSLIREDVVLTAAHCVYGQGDYELVVRAGEWDTSSDDPDYPHVDVDVADRIIHEGYNSDNLWNDVAILKLAKPVQLAAHINTICLPHKDGSERIDVSDCVAAGWGKDSFEDGAYSSVLKKVELGVVDHDACQDSLRTTRLGNYFKLDDSFTCAGGEKGKDTCKGDGGTGMVCRLADSYDKMALVGVVSWGIGCGREGIPGVYADVNYLLPWIHDHMPAH